MRRNVYRILLLMQHTRHAVSGDREIFSAPVDIMEINTLEEGALCCAERRRCKQNDNERSQKQWQ